MSDSVFNIILTVLFFVAVCFNCFAIYKISFSSPLIKTRTILIDNRCKTPIQGIYHLDEDDWKEIKSETL